MNATHLSLIPVISEKAYGVSQNNTYVFKVPTTANKHEITQAVAAQYGVKVADVRIVIAKGKVKQTIRKGKPVAGRRSDVKKAYVTLVEGDRLKIFDEVEQEEKK